MLFQAIILNFRGTGSFIPTQKYGDEISEGQLLSPQNSVEPPFNQPSDVFKNSRELETYLKSIKQQSEIVLTANSEDEKRSSRLMAFWKDINGEGYNFETLEEKFESLANSLMNYLCLVVGNHPYRIVECEIYYYDKNNHPDPYVHKRKEQLTSGKWYFNDMGLDITLGNRKSEIYASILLCGIQSLKTNQYTSGTANVVREIFDKFGTVILDGNGICLREINKGVFEEEHAITAKRVGLTKKPEDLQNFIDKKYRYIIELNPQHHFNGKEELVKQFLKSGLYTKSEAKDVLGYNLKLESD